MKPSEIKGLVSRTVAERLLSLGYDKQGCPDDCFGKVHSDALKIGVCILWARKFGDLRIKFLFGIYDYALEQQLVDLGGAYGGSTNWTVSQVNLNFPESYRVQTTFNASLRQKLCVMLESDKFSVDMTEDAVLKRTKFNLDVIEQHSLPELEQSNAETVLRELERGSVPAELERGQYEARLLAANYLANKMGRVKFIIQSSRASEDAHPSMNSRDRFFENLLRACEDKKA